MDVPNLFLQTFEAAAADGGSMKRPAAAKKNTTKKAPAGSASADGNKPKEPVHVSSQLPKAKSTPNKDSSSSPGNSRYVMMRESCHYVAVSHRTYITGKIGKTKPLLIEIHSRWADKQGELAKELFREAERLHSSVPWGGASAADAGPARGDPQDGVIHIYIYIYK